MENLGARFAVKMLVACLAGGAALAWGADPGRWSYSGATGPANWGKLDKDSVLCAKGENQAPFDIADAKVRKGDIPPLLFNYQPGPLTVVDDGRMIQVRVAPGSWLTIDGKRYQLSWIEFHKPAEFKVNGKAQDMAAHLVHKDAAGKTAIVAVPLAQGAENALVKSVAANFPVTKGKDVVVDSIKVNAKDLLPQNKGYYGFEASLTTPPCTEGVAWYVLRTPMQVSGDQLGRFAKVYPQNARPVQPQKDRDIIGTP